MSLMAHHTPRYFSGMKVEVEIPLPNTRVFRDWAIISETDEDLVSLQLSRDILPDGVTLRVGQVLTVNSQTDGNKYSCRAFIVSKGYEQDLLLRFTSETIANEMREFYRVDAFLPLRFSILNDQNPANVREQWEAQRKLRRDEEAARERSRLESERIKLRMEERDRALKIEAGASPAETALSIVDRQNEALQDYQYYLSWGTVTTLAVNISGGGLRIYTDQKFYPDELVMLEAYIPSSRSIIDITARVVSTNSGENEETGGSVAMQFVFIDESARSAINSHISNIQLKRIRQFKGFTDVEPATGNSIATSDKHYAYIDSISVSEKTDPQKQIKSTRVRYVVIAVVFFCVVGLLFSYFYRYVLEHPKSEIQKIFEKGIRKYGGGG